MESFSKTLTWATKHLAKHSLWMIPMAAIMVPSPALASSFAGAADMILTSGFNFFADGHAGAIIENTLNGNLWAEGYTMFDGTMDMSAHAGEAASHAAHETGGAVVEQANHTAHSAAQAATHTHVQPSSDFSAAANHSVHAGHCTMDTHGEAFDAWSEKEYGGVFGQLFGDIPTASEQWGEFSNAFCPNV